MKIKLGLLIIGAFYVSNSSMQDTSPETITFNSNHALYSILANNTPGYPLELLDPQYIPLRGTEAKVTSSGKVIHDIDVYKGSYDSVDDYLTQVYKTIQNDSPEKVLQYAVQTKFDTYPRARYVLLKTGNKILKYSPLENATRPEIEAWYATKLGPLLMEIRQKYVTQLAQNHMARIQNYLQRLRFSTWEWLANNWNKLWKK